MPSGGNKFEDFPQNQADHFLSTLLPKQSNRQGAAMAVDLPAMQVIWPGAPWCSATMHCSQATSSCSNFKRILGIIYVTFIIYLFIIITMQISTSVRSTRRVTRMLTARTPMDITSASASTTTRAMGTGARRKVAACYVSGRPLIQHNSRTKRQPSAKVVANAFRVRCLYYFVKIILSKVETINDGIFTPCPGKKEATVF